jgi:predicted amidohydrolase YtcJ
MRSGKAVWRTTPAELRDIVATASRAGLQVAAHAIGDSAIAAMCDAVESAGAVTHRHRVEHCTICPPDLRRRLARLGMVAVMQPMAARFAQEPSSPFGAHDRWNLAAHGPLIKAGVPVAFSSDLPVMTDPNPWLGIRAAVEDRINGISELAALKAYTYAGAYSSFEENIKGTLEPGMLADLQVYDHDPLAQPRARWHRLRPRAVLLGGRSVFGAEL